MMWAETDHRLSSLSPILSTLPSSEWTLGAALGPCCQFLVYWLSFPSTWDGCTIHDGMIQVACRCLALKIYCSLFKLEASFSSAYIFSQKNDRSKQNCIELGLSQILEKLSKHQNDLGPGFQRQRKGSGPGKVRLANIDSLTGSEILYYQTTLNQGQTHSMMSFQSRLGLF